MWIWDYLIVIVLVAIGISTTICTLFDIYHERFGCPRYEILTIFSLQANFKQLVIINESQHTFNSINGLKTLAAFWVIFGHRSIPMDSKCYHTKIIFDKGSYMGSHAVVTFITCSGVLVSQSLLRSLDRNDLNVLKLFTNRILRYFPILALAMLYAMSWLSGVLSDRWYSYDSHKKSCGEMWLPTLLFFKNFYLSNDIKCLDMMWYVTLDVQLFLISPILMIFLKKFKKKAVAVLTITILVVQVYTFYQLRAKVDYMLYFRRPLYRFPEFFVSIIAGYYMYNIKNQDNKLTAIQTLKSWTCWLLSLGFIFCHVYDILTPLFPNYFYYAIERSLWSLALCWIIYASHYHKTGGLVRWFLSLNMWQPFSKIGLSLYLIHSYYLRSTSFKIDQKSSFGCWWNVQIHTGDVFYSSLLGLLVYLVIEAPTVKILEMVWRKNKKSETSEEMTKSI